MNPIWKPFLKRSGRISVIVIVQKITEQILSIYPSLTKILSFLIFFEDFWVTHSLPDTHAHPCIPLPLAWSLIWKVAVSSSSFLGPRECIAQCPSLEKTSLQIICYFLKQYTTQKSETRWKISRPFRFQDKVLNIVFHKILLKEKTSTDSSCPLLHFILSCTSPLELKPCLSTKHCSPVKKKKKPNTKNPKHNTPQ